RRRHFRRRERALQFGSSAKNGGRTYRNFACFRRERKRRKRAGFSKKIINRDKRDRQGLKDLLKNSCSSSSSLLIFKNMSLSNESVAVVTGAASGIGRALAIRLAQEKIAGIAVSDVNENGLKETVEL